MPQLSPVALEWLQGFTKTVRLQQEILNTLNGDVFKATNTADSNTETGGNETALTDKIMQQDRLIRQLPFDQLSAEDVTLLNDKITLLQQNHQALIKAISDQRKTLLDQSSQSKKTGRSIKAYQQAQDL